MLRSSFFGFNTAYRAISANQRALDIVGQNMSNVYTNGYTRQRLDLCSVGSGGYNSLYGMYPDISPGGGVDMSGISQIRDPFLDVRFRREAAKLGMIDSKLNVMEDLEGIFDEISVAGLENGIEDFIKQLQQLTTSSGTQGFDNIAKASADVLTKLFNQYSKQVTTIKDKEMYQLENVNLAKVNDLLKGIANLNESIRNDHIAGNPALELMDDRNVMIDELAQYMRINVTYVKTEVGPNTYVDELKLDLVSDDDSINILDHNTYTQFKSGINADGDVEITISTAEDSIKHDIENINSLLKDYNNMLAAYNGLDPALLPNDPKRIAYKNSLNKLYTNLQDHFNPPSSLTQDATFGLELNSVSIIDGPTATIQNTFSYTHPEKVSFGATDVTGMINYRGFDETRTTAINSILTEGIFKGSLDMLNSKGEFDTPPNTTRGLDYYTGMVDIIANELATRFNQQNAALNPDFDSTQPEHPIDNPKLINRPLFSSNVKPDNTTVDKVNDILTKINTLNQDIDAGTNVAANTTAREKLVAELQQYVPNAVTVANGNKLDIKLVTDSTTTPKKVVDLIDSTTNTVSALSYNAANQTISVGADDITNFTQTKITAKNLVISDGWRNSDYGITTTRKDKPGDDTAASENVLALIGIFDKKIDFLTDAGSPVFKGTLEDCFTQVCSVLSLDISSNNKIFKNYATVLNGIAKSKDSISGVEMNEEGINLLKYQKSYNAAARLMTTLDEAIDTIINKMGVVGR